MLKNMSEIGIAIAGLGVVGAETARQLTKKNTELHSRAGTAPVLRAVSARTQKDRGFDASGIDFVPDATALAARNDIDIVVELIGGSDGVAFDLCQAALKQGKHVVTANKAMIAHHGHLLAQRAEDANVQLCFEAAVAGGIPALKLLREGLSGNEIERVTGILNGTCNYILTEMTQTGRGFDEVLREAQEKGYAEAEPSFDIDGIDAAHKLSILAALAYGEQVNFPSVNISGIRAITDIDIAYAGDLGFVIKLLGSAGRGRVPTVQPWLVARDSQLAKIDGALNAVAFDAEPVRSIVCTGPGAGAGPTASAVLADIIDIARGRRSFAFGRPAASLKSNGDLKAVPPGRFYLRVMVRDEIGVLSAITSILRDHQISVESMLQKSQSANKPVPLVLTMHETAHEAVAAACAELRGQSFVDGDVLALPVLDSA